MSGLDAYRRVLWIDTSKAEYDLFQKCFSETRYLVRYALH